MAGAGAAARCGRRCPAGCRWRSRADISRGTTTTEFCAGTRSCRGGSYRTGTAFEIGGVPARTLQLETGSGELFGESFSSTVRAYRQWRIGHLLQDVFRVSTGPAFVCVNGHGLNLGNVKENLQL
jgi:hypothetical protein